MKLLVLAVLLVLPARAENWERYVSTGKGAGVLGIAEPHPLSYFTRYPSLRDAENICYGCPPDKRLALAKQAKLKEKQRTEVRLVGTIHGFKIYDVFYYFSLPWRGEETLEWKAILVRKAPNQFREIYHYQKTQGGIWPSYLFQVGGETLLGLADDGYRGNYAQQNWSITKDAFSRIEMSPIWKAAREVLPEGYLIYDEVIGRERLAQGVIEVKLLKITKSRPYRFAKGLITVHFALKSAQITVTGVRYDPKGNPRGNDDEDADAN